MCLWTGCLIIFISTNKSHSVNKRKESKNHSDLVFLQTVNTVEFSETSSSLVLRLTLFATFLNLFFALITSKLGRISGSVVMCTAVVKSVITKP